MIVYKFLVINNRGSVKAVEREPKLAANEISLRLCLEVPASLFERPRLEATMKVPNEAVPKIKITPAVTDNVEKMIKQATGLNMVVSIVDQEEETKKTK